MRSKRFQDYLLGVLKRAEHPDIAAVELYDVPGNGFPLRDIQVRGTDGVTLYLRIVHGAPSAGGDHAQPEKIVEKTSPGVEVTRS
jgi:hypothetical protein